jgi:hypothetical protein
MGLKWGKGGEKNRQLAQNGSKDNIFGAVLVLFSPVTRHFFCFLRDAASKLPK